MDRELNAHEKQTLLAIARQAIVHGVQTGQEYIEPREEKTLNQRNGCFVTIKQNGQLRGCIGNFQSELPLVQRSCPDGTGFCVERSSLLPSERGRSRQFHPRNFSPLSTAEN